MMKLYFASFLLIISGFVPFFIFAETKYISEDLSVYIRRGPGQQYPLLGTVTTGDKVEVLEVSKDGKFARIQDKKNRVAWIENAALQSKPTARIRIKELEKQLSHIQDELNAAQHSQDNTVSHVQEKLSENESARKELTQENQKLLSENERQKKLITTLKDQLMKNHRNINPNWFLYGGIVAGGGLLLGLLLPVLMPRRRNNRWID